MPPYLPDSKKTGSGFKQFDVTGKYYHDTVEYLKPI